jgi:signal transduction histidine kinase
MAHSGREDGYLAGTPVTWDDSRYGRGPTGMAIKTKKSFAMNIADPAFAPWSEQARQRGYVVSLAVPLIYARDKCIGALNFYSDDPGYFSPDKIKLCEIFANQAAVAIENTRLVEGLETKVFERTRALEDTNKELVLRREEAEAASRSKTDFLANMSHELRTPLNAIMGFSEIMLMGMAGPVSDKQREFLGDISKSGNHLLSLINDILDLSKVEAGKVELEPDQVIVGELVSGSLLMFKEKALKHAIKVESSIDPAVPQIVADRRKLKQVLVNLLSNAFKFTPDGGSVRVSTRLIADCPSPQPSMTPLTPAPLPWREREKGRGGLSSGEEGSQSEIRNLKSAIHGNFIEFSVADTGHGIDPEHQPLLFQPFQQIDSSLTRKHAGTGLGLSLCRRFIELHGGRIWVESEPGKGSTFRFVVPVRQA